MIFNTLMEIRTKSHKISWSSATNLWKLGDNVTDGAFGFLPADGQLSRVILGGQGKLKYFHRE